MQQNKDNGMRKKLAPGSDAKFEVFAWQLDGAEFHSTVEHCSSKRAALEGLVRL